MLLTKRISIVVMLATLVTSFSVFAAEPIKKSFTETEFLSAFSGKSRKVVMEKLGAPAKKEQSVRPSNAEGVIGRPVDSSKPVNVEMWYYSNKVEYAPKKLYKMTELTFVNDRCMNIAFFNKK
ncbi:hypothetical protein A7981_06150 [Methylovorus sp. MM2]|uniref:hypothetical protein n=1 Tax=Methylovorus sp. MM2 TaxID=1848038 RepID=UPI0007DEF0BD|nr:hypothetical protein [Methylovorus sp. MM2]OAM53009.1 hypothetical protein A7981_06150 [Methylovorus sp. MM2]